jgi:AcrR family transcriptional regulator
MNRPSPAQIREIAEALLDEARAGVTRPTVTELARRTGVARPTLYRSHPDVIAGFLTHAARHHEATPQPPRPTQQLVNRIAKLRQENEDLRLHVEHYEEHIRRLTIENTRIRNRLAQLNNVTSFDSHRQQQLKR